MPMKGDGYSILGVLLMKVGLILVVLCYLFGAHELARTIREERVG